MSVKRIIIYFTVFGFLFFSSCKKSISKDENVKVDAGNKSNDYSYGDFIGEDYLIDSQHSYVGFKIKYFGFSPVRGRFNDFEGTVFYDENNISELSLSVVIDAASINTGNSTRDEDLLNGSGWFNKEQYPQIRFQSEYVIKNKDEGFNLIGDFTMKGITKEISIAFEKPTSISRDYSGNHQVDFSGRLKINRKDYGIEGGDFWSSVMENGLTQLSDEVEIELDIHIRKPDYQRRYEDTKTADIRKLILNTIKEKGVEIVIDSINKVNTNKPISSGALSTIGYTLNSWKMHKAAREIFKKRLELYPEKKSNYSQLGITELYENNIEKSKDYFEKALKMDSLDTRAIEYLKLINKLDLN